MPNNIHAFKSQLLQMLSEHGWEVVEKRASEEWWAAEFWQVQSCRACWGLELFVVFLNDPMEAQSVWAITAHETMPIDRSTAEEGIAELCSTKGRVAENLQRFFATIDAFRNKRQSEYEAQSEAS